MNRCIVIGGLVAVGFDPSADYLLTVSHSGRGVFSTKTWARVARDFAVEYPVDGRAIGIGPIDGLSISVDRVDSGKAIRITSANGALELLCETDGIEIAKDERLAR